MNRKTVLIALIGALSAGLVCLIIGLILFFVMRGNAIVVVCSFLAICMGAAMTAVAGIALAISLIIGVVNKRKNKDREENLENDG